MGTEPSGDRTLVLVTGMSGAGKSTALKILEDLGYEAIDNLPLSLLSELVQARGENGHRGALALGIDSRTRGFDPGEIERFLEPLLGTDGPGEIALLFLDCETEVLRRRFSETRRPHPMAHDGPVDEGIEREHALLGWVRERADITLNTSRLSVRDLRDIIVARFESESKRAPAVFVLSFAYSRGLPPDADFVFDVRFLSNPHHVPMLRLLTGREPEVARHVRNDPAYGPFFEGMVAMLRPLLPAFERDGRSYLTIALGCTGGRHRSVAAAEHLAETLGGGRWQVTYRPTVARFGSPPGVRAWATNTLRPVAWTRIPNPASSLSQKTAEARSTVRRSMVLLFSLTAPMSRNPSLVQEHGGAVWFPGDRAGFRRSGKPSDFRSANRSSNRNRLMSNHCPHRLSLDPSWGLYPTCGENTTSMITVNYHPIDHKNT